MEMSVTSAQRVLASAGFYAGAIDGIAGAKTREAFREAISRSKLSDDRKREILVWSFDRQFVAAVQIILASEAASLNAVSPGPIDGWYGPLTEEAILAFEHRKTYGFEEDLNRPDEGLFPQLDFQADEKPFPFESAMEDLYGAPGNPSCSAGVVIPPFPLYVPWSGQSITRFACHEEVEESANEAFRRIHEEYRKGSVKRDLGIDLFGGCYNYRRKRGGSSWSTHAYGIAIDFDPGRNRLRWGRDVARLARPDAEAFWGIWESLGWVSLGRERNFDWMHVQAARIG